MSVDPLKVSTLALVGSPNSGKTTLFNWLTGSSARTVNYAGSTVDCFRGRSLDVYGPSLHVLDTPGIYSLQPHGRDEEVTLQALTQLDDVKAVVLVIDGTQLNRQLYLVRQMQELQLPMVIALTMMDLVKQAGRELDVQKLSSLIGAPVLMVDGKLGGGVKELLAAAREMVLKNPQRKAVSADLQWDAERIEREVGVSEGWTLQVVRKSPQLESLERLRAWDKLLLHPWWGILAFIVIMSALFSSIFWVAAPAMDLVDAIFGWVIEQTIRVAGNGLLGDFLANGIIAGVGSVLVFVPQIFILFFGLILLEDSGYLARAATIADRPLHKLGLSGRAFVPLLSGFACAVPAVMATRNIRSPRERWMTVFILPFMTCSARLPVYALLLTFLFGMSEAWKAGLVLTGLYIGGALIGAVGALILNQILKPAHDAHFLMELPFYRRPQLRLALRQAWRRTANYVKKAGPTIFTFVLILWIGTHVPHYEGAAPAQQLQDSVVGKVGQVIEPAFTPMGLDWRAGVGIVSAFVAREVFVSSMAVIFSLAEEGGKSLQAGLLERMRAATFGDVVGGQPVFTTSSVAGLIVFFMIALQCLSTTGVTWREMNSWKFAIVQLVSLNVAAYLAAVVTVQGMRALGFA
jgi:ferrous iron transport protein B